eukprot:m.47984 g.47984  ORF g.47984 m.47984 type:complete len:346 (+) comp13258_c0_seq2:1919-2956(+)
MDCASRWNMDNAKRSVSLDAHLPSAKRNKPSQTAPLVNPPFVIVVDVVVAFQVYTACCFDGDKVKQNRMRVLLNGLPPERLSRALNHKAVVTAFGQSILHHAIQTNQRDFLREILHHRPTLDVLDMNQYTPLHLAAMLGRVECARMLLQHGVSVDVRGQHYNTPLHCASKLNHPQVALLLLRFGANVNATNRVGNTPLHMCCNARHTKAIKLLLAHGADSNLTNQNGVSPKHLDEACASLEEGIRSTKHLSLAWALLEGSTSSTSSCSKPSQVEQFPGLSRQVVERIGQMATSFTVNTSPAQVKSEPLECSPVLKGLGPASAWSSNASTPAPCSSCKDNSSTYAL